MADVVVSGHIKISNDCFLGADPPAAIAQILVITDGRKNASKPNRQLELSRESASTYFLVEIDFQAVRNATIRNLEHLDDRSPAGANSNRS